MSDFVHKEGNGSLFDNSYKEEPKHPDMKGKATLENGEVVDVAGWWKVNNKDEKYLSISIREEYVKKETESISPNDPGDEDDSLPF